MAAILEEIRKAQRAEGPANILAIGTATPSNYILQADFPDFYFRITKSEHMIDLKEKFKRICKKSMIEKRYMHLTEEILKKNPNMCDSMVSSLDARLDIMREEIPKLGKEAAEKAINEWGQPKSKITHLVFCSLSGLGMPGGDYQLAQLLGLNPSVKRLNVYEHGCFSGGTILRVAKDLAENNKGARILVVCSEMTVSFFRGVESNQADSLIGHALFGDGASAAIIGADSKDNSEHALFQLVSAAQIFIPYSHHAITAHLREVGLIFHLSRDIPNIITKDIENCLLEAFTPLGIKDWNSIFWIAHPGGPMILNQIKDKLGLKEEKLTASRHVLREFGNMFGSSVFFVLDEMRKKSIAEGKATTGEGLDWGVLFGFGPGVTVETVVLHSMPI